MYQLAKILTRKTRCVERSKDMAQSSCIIQAVETYFRYGFEYNEILKLLYNQHGICISLRTLQRLLKLKGLRRRGGNNVQSVVVLTAITEMIANGGENRGYRNVHHRLVEKGIQVSREVARMALKTIDPEGTERRSSHVLKRRTYRCKGPNEVWHIDGNDKIKPFGFCIHGAIDGFSRRILWLHVANTNKDPSVIAHFYTKFVKGLGFLPRRIRGLIFFFFFFVALPRASV